MSYIRLEDQTRTTRYPPNNPSTPPSKPRSLLMKLPQYGPRDLKTGKVSSERKRKLLLSYLPDWSVIPICLHRLSYQPHPGSSRLCLRTLNSLSSHTGLTESPLQRRFLCSGQHLRLQASLLLRRYLVSLTRYSYGKISPDILPNSLRHP